LYHGQEEYRIQSDGKYPALAVATTVDGDSFATGLKEHQAGKTDYPSFCRMAAAEGVEKWVVDTEKMTCTYFDKSGKEMLVEKIPEL
jgi:uncharacterized protein YbcV (DUF1398 family)